MLDLGIVSAPESLGRDLARTGDGLMTFLERHRRGDVGEAAKWVEAIESEGTSPDNAVHSVFRLSDMTPIWITTNLDRLATTVRRFPLHLEEKHDLLGRRSTR